MLDEPAKDFMARGMRRRAAKALSRLLREDVAPTVSVLLPDIQHSSALGTLVIARTELAAALPALTERLMPGPAPGWATAAELPLVWLDAVNHTLIARASGRAGTAVADRPRPTALLVDARTEAPRVLAELTRHAGPDRVRGAGAELGGLLRTRIDAAVDEHRSLAHEWTGWALLAVAEALRLREHELLVPVDSVPAATAYRTGHALVVATALDLVTG